MLEHVLSFLKDQLNNYIQLKSAGQNFEVVFPQPRNQKAVSLQNDAITILLVNLEEDYTFRSGAAYERMLPQSQSSHSYKNPHLYLVLYVLFGSLFPDYSQSLEFLSVIIKFFQSHRLFTSQKFPELSSEIEKLTIELVNLPFTEQREVWAALGMSYVPSVIYKVRMVVFVDTDTVEADSDVTDKEVDTSRKDEPEHPNFAS